MLVRAASSVSKVTPSVAKPAASVPAASGSPTCVHMLPNRWGSWGASSGEARSIHFDALKKEAGRSRLGDFHYIPVVFHEAERPRRQQKELLAPYGVIL